MAKIDEVAAAFVRGRAETSSSALTVATIEQGMVAISYATPVAWRKSDGTIEVTSKKYSQSTSRHVNAIKDAALLNGNRIEEVDR